MEWITDQAVIKCGHDGKVTNKPSQRWVTIGMVPVLVDPDPEGRGITACPNFGPTMKPCKTTLKIATGRSEFIRIDGHRVILSTLDGLTDGTVPGTVHYTVRNPGQAFVLADR
jgi:hypothetical protein